MRRPKRALRRLRDWRRSNSHKTWRLDDSKGDAFSFGADLVLLASFIVPALGVLGAVVFGWPF